MDSVQQYVRAAQALKTVDFYPALEKMVLEENLSSAVLEVAFTVAEEQNVAQGLRLHNGEDESTLVVPWVYFTAAPTAGTAVAQQQSTSSPILTALHHYVSNRGIPMPFYTNGSKITEEGQELREALLGFLKNPSSANVQALQEEVADVIFTAAIAARQGNFTPEEAMARKIAKDTGRGPKV